MGHRPVLLVSRNSAYEQRNLVVAAQVTTRIRNVSAELTLGLEDGMPRNCVANLETLVTVSKRELDHLMIELSPGKIAAMDDELRYALGLD